MHAERLSSGDGTCRRPHTTVRIDMPRVSARFRRLSRKDCTSPLYDPTVRSPTARSPGGRRFLVLGSVTVGVMVWGDTLSRP
jgi:hypothetical protein